ncbi:hypothetical protein [Spirillospora albida]|uniref:hypothetical protein n=1 Tax=Spirillospora albida TaxID=58123 RepID=UPI0005613E2B|nr:hypothetical protein [Spirillospora albida]
MLSSPSPDASAAPSERGARRWSAALVALAATAVAVPAAVLTVPDATPEVVPSAVGDLGSLDVAALLRATGLALPALLLAVPVGSVAARRWPPPLVLAAGGALLLGGCAAARIAGTVPQVAAARTVLGAGAGLLLPAALVLVRERRSPALAAVWAGVLAGALLLAAPLALNAVPAPGNDGWRIALAPFPWTAPLVLAVAAACAVPRWRADPLPPPRGAERARLVLPLVPAAGLALLAVVAAHGWSPGARLVVAAVGLAALLGLALAAGRDATAGDPSGCAVAMVAAGLLCHPVAGPLAGLAAAGPPGGGTVPVAPFAAAAGAALAGALAAVVPSRPRTGVLAGYALIVAAFPAGLAVGGDAGRWALLVPLGAGTGLALAASLRDATPGAALFGLTLCFPAVLTGQLLVLSLQASQLQRARPLTHARQVAALTAGHREWLVAAGAAALLLAAASLLPGRAPRNARDG